MPVIRFSQTLVEEMLDRIMTDVYSIQATFALHKSPVQYNPSNGSAFYSSMRWRQNVKPVLTVASSNPPAWEIDFTTADEWETAFNTGDPVTWWSLSSWYTTSFGPEAMIQGSVSGIGGGGDLELSEVNLVQGQDYKMQGVFRIEVPKNYSY